MPNLTLEGRLKGLPDIQRTWLWEIYIPNVNTIPNMPDIKDDDLVIRARTCSLPSRGNEAVESNFMGFKQFFPGKVTYGNTMEATFEEMEDQKIAKFLYAWRQYILDVDPNSPTAGASGALTKRISSRNIYILQYKHNGSALQKKVQLFNAWPENVSDVALDMNGGEAVKYSVTFRFDYWLLV
jgi:hypothetical protein